MSQKARDYTNLKETEKLYDAIHDFQTSLKDYSMEGSVVVRWRWDSWAIRKRLVMILVGEEIEAYYAPNILPVINEMLERSTHDKDRWMPREKHKIDPFVEHGKPMYIDTTGVNEESLRDHIAEIRIGGGVALVDLQELLKATRYA